MRKFLARRAIKIFGDRYGYDVGYMDYLLDVSPAAFFGVAKLAKLAGHHESAPREAIFAAKLVGALTEDCGPCTQLAVRFAEEAGVPAGQIRAVLTRDVAAMSDDTRLGFEFADAVVRRAPAADGLRRRIRTRWGNAGVVDLSIATQVGRIFPMLKFALGYAHTCQRVQIGDNVVDVVKKAA